MNSAGRPSTPSHDKGRAPACNASHVEPSHADPRQPRCLLPGVPGLLLRSSVPVSGLLPPWRQP